ncbi:[FeFe] hydrogenase H-cluster maturation GTPase HydF [Tepiditoga spiralis]|uniref:[FeFe] hydrogenase H-cluster maturation GTPase HydF n=1 Tax=Tepiditoga spiralis TaxID=2108365 RepID=A0A7G1G6R9_9BACT|nr:[FeFe] hydrogenase H-cluster maturation GTPase HydF [Tepiditoga spiralis]BBE30844.1 [FeFe] hydrogenase H-cluster maturation GTPase HydF [Tepiditoga spiralis]
MGFGGYRNYVVIAGKRNVGKSSTVNAIMNQDISIVSDHPGTTTDPVYKAFELQPIGPVTFIDTPGIDDEGLLGEMRIKRAKKAFYKADVAVLIVDDLPNEHEFFIMKQFEDMNIPYLIAVNKIDEDKEDIVEYYKNNYDVKVMGFSAKNKINIDEFKKEIVNLIPEEKEISLLPDNIDGGDVVVMVIPIDLGAPKGRLIMPQIVAIRETLDKEAIAVATKERELRYTLDKFKELPKLVVTDSQAVMKVASDVPEEVPLTTFSVLEARHKGDLQTLVKGVKVVERLEDNDTVIIMEGCSHRPLTEDIGTVKIPRWLTNHTGKSLNFKFISGKEFPDPEELENAKLVIHCGGCTLTRKMMLRRIKTVTRLGIPIVNYGVLISYLHGVLERALEPFNEVCYED